MKEKVISYKSENITITYEPDICIHAAECVSGLPEVFDINKKPWVNVKAASPEKIIETIKKCPSGALKYESNKKTNNDEEIKMEKTKITIMPDGPIMLEGNLTVNKMSGENIKDAEKMFLCRCGASANKPFCDGKHKAAEFKAD